MPIVIKREKKESFGLDEQLVAKLETVKDSSKSLNDRVKALSYLRGAWTYYRKNNQELAEILNSQLSKARRSLE